MHSSTYHRHLLPVLTLVTALTGCGSGREATPTQLDQPVTGQVCPDGSTVEGIDVSDYQGTVDWAKVKASGRAFAITQINDGSTLDTTFSTNWSGIKSAGMIRGAYQFFRPNRDATTQANLVVSKVGVLGDGDLPVMLDVEVTGSVSASGIASAISTWMSIVEAGTGKKPIIYTGAYFWDDSVGSSAFADYPLAIASYGVTCPRLPDAWASTGWTFHQYSATGSVSGISGDVDLDVFNGTQAELEAFASGGSTSSSTWDSNGVAVDFDGDGVGDILGIWESGKLTAYLSAGAQDIGTGFGSVLLAAPIDIDGDGLVDIVAVLTDGTLMAYLNGSTVGSAQIASQTSIGTGWSKATRLTVVDFDGDGREDLVATFSDGTLRVYRGAGSAGAPKLVGPTQIGTGFGGITRLRAIDLDGDGLEDLVGTWSDGTLTFYENGSTTGSPKIGSQTNIGSDWDGVDQIVVVDADNDGKRDLVAAASDGTLTAYLNGGTVGSPGFSATQVIGSGWDGIDRIIIKGDVDGVEDYYGRNSAGLLYRYTNAGTSGTAKVTGRTQVGTGWQNISKFILR